MHAAVPQDVLSKEVVVAIGLSAHEHVRPTLAAFPAELRLGRIG
jgi:hypothetical protein